jgi:hypothetical protein
MSSANSKEIKGNGKDAEGEVAKKTLPSVAAKEEIKGPKVGINFALKAKYAAYTTLIFFLIANPETYKLIQKFAGSWVTVASEGGCPTAAGFFLHSGLFFLVLWSFMLFPRDF